MNEKKYIRDNTSGAIINTDVNAFNKYKMKKQQTERLDSLEKKMDNLYEILERLVSKIDGD